jgi:ADP-L-glycero-D-manno-heptose 6-epimerase
MSLMMKTKSPITRIKRSSQELIRNELFDWLANHPMKIDFVFHLGARTDTTEFDYAILEKLNVDFSKKIWNYCAEKIFRWFMHLPLQRMVMVN